MENNKRVVITGMGIWSCLGTSLDEVRESLYNGKSGIVVDPVRQELGFRSPLTASVEKPDLKKKISRSMRQFMSEEAQYAYCATEQALAQAGMSQEYIDAHEIGVLYGNDSTAKSTYDAVSKIYEYKSTQACGSGAIFQSMCSNTTQCLATLFRLKGINLTTSGACASGSHAIGLAYLLIKNGLQDCVIAGGAQEVNPECMGSFDGIQAFSTAHIDEPAKASRPFDKNRDGLVPSGGGATLIIESLDSALARGARPIAEIIGWGFSGNGDHISTPNVAGPQRSIELAIQSAGVAPTEIGYVNAHATSTHAGDGREAMAIANVFGDYKVPVTSTKSQTGHECWMAGASEAIYSILMMKNNFIAGNINFEEPDEETACINVIAKTQEAHFDMFLSNSFGFGGTNSTIIVKDFK